ncbi:MAG: type II toxin-antitoxin system RelE/ParE family toxin [Verrucomicrobia bacterium]|nr:type II toxin-antitoxin system RelE/ParE family toxin [Verrucomicrobiota bacterium]
MKFSDQVVAALKELNPGVKRDIRRAMDDVNQGKKRDVRSLRGRLAGFRRLRVGKYRAVFRYDDAGELIVEFFGPRSTVYEAFQPPSAPE